MVQPDGKRQRVMLAAQDKVIDLVPDGHCCRLGFTAVKEQFVGVTGGLQVKNRAGGILFPIVRGLAATFGSEPGPTARKIGAFLMQVEYQATCVTTAMWCASRSTGRNFPGFWPGRTKWRGSSRQRVSPTWRWIWKVTGRAA